MTTDAADARDAGIQMALDATDAFWRATALQAIEHLASTGRPFTSDTVRDELGVPDGPSPASWGAMFRAAATAGLIARCGYTTSRRPESRGRVVGVWRGTRQVRRR